MPANKLLGTINLCPSGEDGFEPLFLLRPSFCDSPNLIFSFCFIRHGTRKRQISLGEDLGWVAVLQLSYTL